MSVELVRQVKADLEARGVPLVGPCGGFAITSRVAWKLREMGAGLLDKPGGNNCQGFSVDYIVFRDGRGVDILGDAGGQNDPRWAEEVDPAFVARWRSPVDPGDGGGVPAPVDPPVEIPTFSHDEFARLVMQRFDAQDIAFAAFLQVAQMFVRSLGDVALTGTQVAAGKKLTLRVKA